MSDGKRARILWVVSGAIQAAGVPSLITWARQAFPQLDLHIGLTAGAKQFVTQLSLQEFSSESVTIDSWGSEGFDPITHHLDIAQGFDGFLIWPLSLNYCSKLASASGEGPVLLALSITRKPVVLYPAFPPGALSNPIVNDALRRLNHRDNVHIVRPPSEGNSLRADAKGPQVSVDPAVVFRTLISELERNQGNDA